MFTLSIVTPEKIFCEVEVSALMVPGSEGYLGILSHHAPLITALQSGKITFVDSQQKVHILAVSSGFLEVSANRASILAEAVEAAGEIDIERAQEAYEREKRRLVSAGSDETDIDLPSIKAAVSRAANRIRIHKDTL